MAGWPKLELGVAEVGWASGMSRVVAGGWDSNLSLLYVRLPQGRRENVVAVFTGTLSLAGESNPPVDVQVEVADSALLMKAGESSVAEWSLDEISVEERSDGFHIFEGEELIFRTRQTGFLSAVTGREDSVSSVAARVKSVRDSAQERPAATAPLEDTANVPPPGVIAAEILEDLEAALAEFAEIATALEERDPANPGSEM